eukprot:jgi/Bigna1/128491/aug1.6_g3199
MHSMGVPPEFICPISHEIMKEPTFNETGNSYERKSIENWYKRSRTDPLTRKLVDPQRLVTNRALKSRIEGFLKERVKKKAAYVIIGKSGSGKSTLINEIGCVLGNEEEDIAKTSTKLQEGCTEEVTTYELEICPDKKDSSSKLHVTLIDTMGFPDPHPKMDTVIERYDQVIEACNEKIHGIIWVLRESRTEYDPKTLRALMREFTFAKCPIYLLYNNSEFLGRTDDKKAENIKTLIASVDKCMQDMDLHNVQGPYLSHERGDLSKRFLDILKDPVIPTKSEMITYSKTLKKYEELLEKKDDTLMKQEATKALKKGLSARLCAAEKSLKQCKIREKWVTGCSIAFLSPISLFPIVGSIIGGVGFIATNVWAAWYFGGKEATLESTIEKLRHKIEHLQDEDPSEVLAACTEWKERLEILRKVLLKRVDDGSGNCEVGFGGSDNKGGGDGRGGGGGDNPFGNPGNNPFVNPTASGGNQGLFEIDKKGGEGDDEFSMFNVGTKPKTRSRRRRKFLRARRRL